MAERMDVASARRKMKSPNIKTRKRALKALHDARRASASKK
ncbi:putative metal homeostasis protein [Weissella diestrammenae]|uniref:Putative metal homeostasis protein n=1 Tax=Weissella diestrammenae TaxID=1162633 RepID=A0A7G9T3M7_9LACO|nr:putative metal homeostasis protein [Weissella diestrammenae]MCM0582682.1 putative metal homeostasis protein [Weissella diestrammenae]QNN74702.1 putative metal homeostasis protein [Weissella diestrammenae]